MCLVSTPMHACSHAGARMVYGEPCARAAGASAPRFGTSVASSISSISPASSRRGSVSSASTDSSDSVFFKSCNFITDYGSHNVPTHCPRCVASGGNKAMSMKDMLGAIKTSVQSARSGDRVVPAPTKAVDPGDSASSKVHTGVPDLGNLGSLGTDRVGREVAANINMHWRNYTQRY